MNFSHGQVVKEDVNPMHEDGRSVGRHHEMIRERMGKCECDCVVRVCMMMCRVDARMLGAVCRV